MALAANAVQMGDAQPSLTKDTVGRRHISDGCARPATHEQPVPLVLADDRGIGREM